MATDKRGIGRNKDRREGAGAGGGERERERKDGGRRKVRRNAGMRRERTRLLNLTTMNSLSRRECLERGIKSSFVPAP